MRFILPALILGLSITMLTCGAPRAQTAGGLMDLPEIHSLTLESYAAASETVEKAFPEDSFLQFEVQLPTEFTPRDFNTLKNRITNGRLYGEVYRADGEIVQDVYPYFRVISFEIDRLISARNWIVTKVLNEGTTLRALEADERGNHFEALIVRINDLGTTEIVRAKGYLKGPRIIVAEYVIPLLLWEKERDKQIYAIKSFELGGSMDTALAEQMMSYSYLDAFSMQYPQSWRMENEAKAQENRIDLSFITADSLRTIFATVDLTLIADQSLRDPIDRSRYPTPLPEIVAARKQAVLDQEFLFDDVMERREYDLAFEHQFQITEVYPLRRKLTDYVTHRQAPVTHEFWITAIKGTKESGKNYIVTMLAPARGDDMSNWALAEKAYEAMIESIR